MKILPEGAHTEIPLRLTPFIADWATASYLKCDFGYLLTQSFLYKYYRIYIHRFIVERPAALYLHCSQSTVALQFTIQGPIRTFIKGYGEVLLETGQYSFFYLPAGRHHFRLDPGEYESVFIGLEPFMLEELAESREEMKELLERLHNSSEKGDCLTPRQMDYRVRDVITGIRNCKETGGNLLVEFSTNISNLLNLYRKSLNDAEYFKRLRATTYTTAMVSIREEVTQNPSIQQHTLVYFAKKHNMSESTLKRYFKVVFKQTLHEFVREECMKKAAWMRTNPALSLDDIADEVGYADKSGFLKSFKKFNPQPLR